MAGHEYGQGENEKTTDYLRRLLRIGAPPDVRANAQAILEAEQREAG